MYSFNTKVAEVRCRWNIDVTHAVTSEPAEHMQLIWAENTQSINMCIPLIFRCIQHDAMGMEKITGFHLC